jgi:hypothetical protein
MAGAKAIVSSYCFLFPMETCPGFPQVPNSDQPNWPYNYGCELQNASLFPAEAEPFLKNIVGGGPSRWGEITDSTNLWQFTYPAMMGASEKLWSPAALTNGSFYGTRQEVFADHRCVLIRRGIPVQPTSAYSWSCDFEWEPPMPPLTPLHPNPANSSWGLPADAAAAGLAASPDAERSQRIQRMLPASLQALQQLPGSSRGSAGGSSEDLLSLWPFPATAVPVPCGGNPDPAWTQVCQGCVAVGSDCRYLAHGDGSSLDACQASCQGMDGCNVINWSPSISDCVFRVCSNPLAPATSPDPAYAVYAIPAINYAVGIDPAHFKVVLDAAVASDPLLQSMVERYSELILWHPAGSFDRPIELTTLTLSVLDPSVRQIQAGVDESYTLSFSPSCTQAFVVAQTVFGARHGLETFSQMVQAERLSGSYSLGAYFGLFNITDAPRFDTRGLMVDSARHFLNPNLLLSIMDALSYVKMNKLEVGFGIDWSYTVESTAFPNLTDSSYSPKGTHMFSRDTISWLVSEANVRGIRLVPYVE